MKVLEEEGSLLEETFLKMNLHLMVTSKMRREKRFGVFQMQKTRTHQI